MRHAIWLVPVVTLISAYQSYALPSQYAVSFTMTGGYPALPPPTGTIVYDPSLPYGSEFLSFIVVWDGVTFDLTSSINYPTITGITGPLVCPGPYDTFHLFINCPNTSWSIGTNPTLSTITMSAGTSAAQIGFQAILPIGAGGNPEPYASGTFQIVPVVHYPIYISDSQNNRVRLVDRSDGITTIAGNGTGGFSGEGASPASAELHTPFGVAAVEGSGSLYIADTLNNRVRMVIENCPICPTNGELVTVAGTGAPSYSGDGGAGNSAAVDHPTGVAVDLNGYAYIADQENNRIRKIGPLGVITTVAGNGNVGNGGDGGPATSAQLYYPTGVAVDAYGNIYIADSNNNRVRKVDTSGIITTVAGNGTAGYSCANGIATSVGLHSPKGVAVDISGNLYIADYGNQCIRKVDTLGNITTIAGNGTASYSGDFLPAINAALNYPTSVSVDSLGNIYIADYVNNRVRMVDTAGVITTIAGNGKAGFGGDGGLGVNGELYEPSGVAVLNIAPSEPLP
jgi:sugar lactone lactonase YvrE